MAAKQLVTPPNPNAQLAQSGTGPGGGGPTSYWLRFFANIVNAINGTVTPANVAQIVLGNGITISSGQGSPQSSVAGNIGDLYLNLSGGANQTLWVKEGGVPGSNTHWAAK